MLLRYKYRLYPTKSQVKKLNQAGGNARWLWNKLLFLNQEQYKKDKTFIWFYDLCKEITKLKKEHIFLKENTYSQSLQQVAKDLELALKGLKQGKGFPKFKKKYNLSDSFRFPQGKHIKINEKYVSIPKIGDVRIKLHRPMPNHKSMTIIQDGDRWFASFVVEKKEQVSNKTNSVGIDLNSKYFATADSEGKTDLIENPQFMKKQKEKIKVLQQRLARTKKRSNNRTKAILRLRKKHQQIANQRKNFLDQTSNRIAKDYGLVSAETLDIKKMKSNHLVAKAVQDAGWYSFLSMLKYKTALNGNEFVQINQWLPSSQRCYSCGGKNKFNLSQREYSCSCGYTAHRDINAARNIQLYGNELTNTAGTAGRASGVDLVLDVLSSDVTNSTMKEEATMALA